MREGPDVSRVAALIGDPARSNMLLALMDGRALTATELATRASVTKQTASSHLAQLFEGGLLAREIQGRHRYFCLASDDVAETLEALISLSSTGLGQRTRTGPKDEALRKARVCYDHLAGDLGVLMMDRFSQQGWLAHEGAELKLNTAGWIALSKIGLAPGDLPSSRRPECRTCLDWSERRHHLAGKAGKVILDRIFKLGWAKRLPDSRVISFSRPGEKSFRDWLA